MTIIEKLSPEWERIEVLCEIAKASASKKKAPGEEFKKLRTLQDKVEALREKGVWDSLAKAKLNMLEFDILAAVMAAELSPNVGNFFLRQNGWGGAGLNIGALRTILSLTPNEMVDFHHALDVSAPLRENRLVQIEGEGLGASLGLAPALRQKVFERAFLTAPPHTTRLTRKVEWNDLVLNETGKARIETFLNTIRYNKTVEGWGYRKQSGPVALFCGIPGTGKTLAASVIANKLGWPLYRADLGRLVSKYIGETEKNLNAVFSAAADTQTVLLFDEADALFGKRSEVSDARDRYANMEISHLLTLIEMHTGPVILTTNLQSHLDSAFLRRFHVVAEFPKPDLKARKELWEKYMPKKPSKLDKIDFDLLAKSVNLTGAEIENASVRAAIMAAAAGKKISMGFLAHAVFEELYKQNFTLKPTALGALGDHLDYGKRDQNKSPETSRAA